MRPVTDIDWSPDNLLLASVAEDGGVCLWQVESGQLVCYLLLSLLWMLTLPISLPACCLAII